MDLQNGKQIPTPQMKCCTKAQVDDCLWDCVRFHFPLGLNFSWKAAQYGQPASSGAQCEVEMRLSTPMLKYLGLGKSYKRH